MNMYLVPSTLQLHQMIDNVGVLRGSVLKDIPKLLSKLKISRCLEHRPKCLPHIVCGQTSFGVYHKIFRYVGCDEHLSIVVIVNPVSGAVWIAKWVQTDNLSKDDVFDLNCSKEVVHKPRPTSPVASFSVQYDFYLGACGASRNDDVFDRRKVRRWGTVARGVGTSIVGCGTVVCQFGGVGTTVVGG